MASNERVSLLAQSGEDLSAKFGVFPECLCNSPERAEGGS